MGYISRGTILEPEGLSISTFVSIVYFVHRFV
jgi:hypothetical protein